MTDEPLMTDAEMHLRLSNLFDAAGEQLPPDASPADIASRRLALIATDIMLLSKVIATSTVQTLRTLVHSNITDAHLPELINTVAKAMRDEAIVLEQQRGMKLSSAIDPSQRPN